MEALKQWAVCLMISGIAGSLISFISPRGTMEKTLRAVIGIFVVSAVCSPIAEITQNGNFVPAFLNESVAEISDNGLEEHMLEACRNAVGNIISQEASEYGISDYSVDAEMYMDDGRCIIIQSVCITIPKESSVSLQEFSSVLEKRLGIPVTVNSN